MPSQVVLALRLPAPKRVGKIIGKYHRGSTERRRRSLRGGAALGLFRGHRAELEFGNLAERIEHRIGQEVGGGFRVAERHEHHVLRHVAVGAHFDFHRAAAGFELNEIAGLHFQPVEEDFDRHQGERDPQDDSLAGSD
jgi:hypothetical protein